MSKTLDLANLRREYESQPLLESTVDSNPLKQFECWFQEWLSVQPLEPTAMVLSTVDSHHCPDSRVVLLKEVWQGKFIFFTNYLSHKGAQILSNAQVALNFYWPELNRQIRVRGLAEKTPGSVSDQYFSTRPFESQCAAIASPQSHKLSSRERLEELYHLSLEKYQHQDIHRPEYWGGYAVTPSEFEFWQGRPQRLHDRLLYKKDQQSWQLLRIAP